MNSLEGLIRKKLSRGGGRQTTVSLFEKGEKSVQFGIGKRRRRRKRLKKTGQGRGQEGNGKMGLEKNNPLSRLKIGLAVGG